MAEEVSLSRFLLETFQWPFAPGVGSATGLSEVFTSVLESSRPNGSSPCGLFLSPGGVVGRFFLSIALRADGILERPFLTARSKDVPCLALSLCFVFLRAPTYCGFGVCFCLSSANLLRPGTLPVRFVAVSPVRSRQMEKTAVH